jgi:allophanate hydrolase
VLTLTAADAARVAAVARAFDARDPYSRAPAPPAGRDLTREFRFGVPDAAQLQFFGDAEYQHLFASALERLESLGGTRVRVDLEPFLAAGRLLYGPWLAERYSAVGKFIDERPDAVLPVTRAIISAGRLIPATEAFMGQHRLAELKRATDEVWQSVDVLVTPTAGTIYTIAAVEQDPIALNANLALYTNFTNLLDLASVAVPAGFRNDGLPFGISLSGPAWSDGSLLALAGRFQPLANRTLGALALETPP